MELYEAIKARASVREYSGSPVEKSAVTRILKAGILAPSGKNGQVWRFAVVQKNKKLHSLQRFCSRRRLPNMRVFG